MLLLAQSNIWIRVRPTAEYYLGIPKDYSRKRAWSLSRTFLLKLSISSGGGEKRLKKVGSPILY